MNWQTAILALFLALNLSAEACSEPNSILETDQPHALVVADDDQACIPQEDATAFETATLDAPFVLIEIKPRLAGMILAATGLTHGREPIGLRRHRWLCVERC